MLSLYKDIFLMYDKCAGDVLDSSRHGVAYKHVMVAHVKKPRLL